MTDPIKQFHDELEAHLEKFQVPCPAPKLSVTITGIPREGLTVKYQDPKKGAATLAEIAKDAEKINAKITKEKLADAAKTTAQMTGTATAGAIGGAGVGVLIGKVVFGVVARIGVASAGVGIGMPLLGPFAVVGGALATAVYAAYKLGTYKRDRESAEALATSLCLHMEKFDPCQNMQQHMQEFAPSVLWPAITVYVSVPQSGLAALWQPPTKQQA